MPNFGNNRDHRYVMQFKLTWCNSFFTAFLLKINIFLYLAKKVKEQRLLNLSPSLENHKYMIDLNCELNSYVCKYTTACVQSAKNPIHECFMSSFFISDKNFSKKNQEIYKWIYQINQSNPYRKNCVDDDDHDDYYETEKSVKMSNILFQWSQYFFKCNMNMWSVLLLQVQLFLKEKTCTNASKTKVIKIPSK